MASAATKAVLTLGVFVIGAGLGVGLKQGWLPVELLAPPAGVLRDDAPSDGIEADAVTGMQADLAQQPEPDPSLLEAQDEPPVFNAETEHTSPPPRKVVRVESHPAEVVRGAARSLPIEEDEEPPPSGIRQAQFEQPAPIVKPAAPAAKDKGFAETLATVEAHLEREEWLAAHKELSRLYWAEPERRAEIMDRINHTAQAIFFSPQPHFINPHVVSSGDRLQTIASQYKLSWEFVAQLNQIDPKRIRDGQKLKVIRGPFSAVVELNDFSMTVHLQGYYVKRYQVGIGKDGASPMGKHTVIDKVVNPQYTAPDGKVISGDDPANPLGERWINLGNSYGIHGTIEPDSIGKAASRGCIRLGDDDVAEVYNFLINGSEVVIRP